MLSLKLSLAVILYAFHLIRASSDFGRSYDLNEENDLGDIGLQIDALLDNVFGLKEMTDSVASNAYIDDPFLIQDFNVSSDGSLTSYECHYFDMNVQGMKNLKVESLRLDMGWMHMDVVTKAPKIRVDGKYRLKGKMAFFSTQGEGNFWMNVNDLQLFSRVSFNRTNEGRLGVSVAVNEMTTSGFTFEFMNLMGGGGWSSLANSLLNKMGNIIFNRMKTTLMEAIGDNVRQHIETKISLLPQNYADQIPALSLNEIISMTQKAIQENNLDPYLLPRFSERFQQDLLFFVLRGRVAIENGSLRGLSSLNRTGNVVATYGNDSIVFEASFGFENLTGSYDWSIQLNGEQRNGKVSLGVNSVSGQIKLEQSLEKWSHPSVTAFTLNPISGLVVDVTGLGPFSFTSDFINTMVSDTLQNTLQPLILGPIQQQLQNQLIHF